MRTGVGRSERPRKKSDEYLQRAEKVIPGMSQTLSKAPTQFVVGVHPYLIERGDGCTVWDVDDNSYLDLTCALGPITLGYNHPSTVNAISEQIAKGNIFGLPNRLEIELAETLCSIVPCAEMVRYGVNGSDATTAAVRLARAHTGRNHIAKCGYHGWQDWTIATHAGRSTGVPQPTKDLTHEFAYNDSASLVKILADNPGQIAAIILEPVGVVEPEKDFLLEVKTLAQDHGAVLVFDEIVTGFRLALGGAQEYYGVIPDIVCLGKGVANGVPLSIVAGRASVMQSFQDVFFSFTYGGEALGLAAATATIDVMQGERVIEHIWRMGRKLKLGYATLAKQYDIPTSCMGLDPHFVFKFRDAEGNDDLLLKSLFLQEAVKRGVLTNASIMISYAHKEADIDRALQAVEGAFQVMREALNKADTESYLEGPPVRSRARPQ